MNGDFARGLDAENRPGESLPTPHWNQQVPVPIPEDVNPVQWLIDRVQAVIIEAVQGGTEPISTKAMVLAQLYQAQALQEIESRLTLMHHDFSVDLGRIVVALETIASKVDTGHAPTFRTE